MFKVELCEDDKVLKYEKAFERRAVRAVIVRGEEILLVKSNKGDYKFPGGGINKAENHHEALIREVSEETGYKIKSVLELTGEIKEVSEDKFDKESAFIMYSYYYKCEVLNEIIEQKLDDYEKELGFVAEWINIIDAIKINENIINNGNMDNISWINRETLALKNIYNA